MSSQLLRARAKIPKQKDRLLVHYESALNISKSSHKENNFLTPWSHLSTVRPIPSYRVYFYLANEPLLALKLPVVEEIMNF